MFEILYRLADSIADCPPGPR